MTGTTGVFNKIGDGTLIRTGGGAFTGNINVKGGKLVAAAAGSLGAANNSRLITVDAGKTLEFTAGNVFGNHATTAAPIVVEAGGVITNAAPATNSGLGSLTLNSATLTATVGNGTSLIDGTLRPGEGYGAWGLNGTVTSTGTSNINVGAVTGMGGRILLSSQSSDTVFNVVNGTLTVAAPLQRGESAPNNGLVKTGAGSMVLTAQNLYTGNTTVNEGTLQLSDDAQLKFVLGASGVNNSISGTGTVVLDGDFVIDTTLADTLSSGTWTLENVSTLTGAYGASFSVFGFTDVGDNKWKKTVGSRVYTFDETTGILSMELITFEDWIAGFGLTGADALGTADPDKDGIANAVEMVLGGNPATGMDTALLPTIELVNADPDGDTTFSDYLLFTYRRTDLSVSAGVTAGCETNTDLGAVWTSAATAPGVVILTNDNYNASFVPPATADTDRVRVYVPRGTAPKIFGRLNVTTPAPTP
jgi:autotransporter-associated beta strand protein